jgi:hypothetical protein
MMTYKEWNLVTSEELNGIAIDYIDPEGKSYSEPFCFYTLDEALNYGKMRIDQLVSLQKKGTHDVQSRAIA